jgi:threonine dehydrogenase-like Zn-dependent dehydrogenase
MLSVSAFPFQLQLVSLNVMCHRKKRQAPGAADEMAKHGQIAFDFGELFNKGQRMGTSQAVKAYNWKLMQLIEQGRAKPSFINSHEMPLGKQPMAMPILTHAKKAGQRLC